MGRKLHKSLLVACGALAREIVTLRQQLGLDDATMTLKCVPAEYHNQPAKIAPAVEEILAREASSYDRIFVAYGECGTGGALDAVLESYGASRLHGAHCYEFYAGASQFREITDTEIGSFFLTDYLVKNFDRLVIKGLGLDRFPHLLDSYFGNYTQVVYLAQTHDPVLIEKAQVAADRLGLSLVHRHVGYGDLAGAVGILAGEKPALVPTNSDRMGGR